MAPKRQNPAPVEPDQPLEPLPPAKRTKPAGEQLTGTEFRSQLRDPSAAFRGLESFIKTAKQLPCADLYDVVEGYLKISGECSEILSLLEGDSRSETELMLIFQTLELILLRTASDLSHYSVVGAAVVRLVCTRMKLLQASLSSVNYKDSGADNS